MDAPGLTLQERARAERALIEAGGIVRLGGASDWSW
jgi:hypothetical protein